MHMAKEREHSSGNMMSICNALVQGMVAACLGVVLHHVIYRVTGYEVGLVAIVIGWFVGTVVCKASKGSGGLTFQLIAVILTYAAIAGTHVPSIIRNYETTRYSLLYKSLTSNQKQRINQMIERKSSDSDQRLPLKELNESAWLSVLTSSQAKSFFDIDESQVDQFKRTIFIYLVGWIAPFMGGKVKVLGWLIIAIGLWQAWRLNEFVPVRVRGPYKICETT